jgi:hypothetical protein
MLERPRGYGRKPALEEQYGGDSIDQLSMMSVKNFMPGSRGDRERSWSPRQDLLVAAGTV